jgi:thioredoxin-related protein
MNKLSIKFSLTGILVIAFFLSMANLLYAQSERINWVSWEQAQDQMKTQKRKIIVDIITDRCMWCKQMDNTTFQDAKLVKYINTNYYAIKFNAEQATVINFKGKSYDFIPKGRSGIHELAIEITNGKLNSFPTLVVMDEEFNTIQPLSGFKSKEELDIILNYFGGNHHKSTPWSIYKESYIANRNSENNTVKKVNNQN